MRNAKAHKIGSDVKIKLISCLALFLILVPLQGCSSAERASAAGTSAKAATHGGKLDACSLLTKEDAESLFGEAAGTPSNSQMGDTVSRCAYSNSTGSKRVSLLARKAPSRAEAQQIFAKAQNESKNLSGSNPQIVPVLGDAAYWAGGNLKQLNVLKGDTWLIINANTGDDPLSACTTTAKKIVLRME